MSTSVTNKMAFGQETSDRKMSQVGYTLSTMNYFYPLTSTTYFQQALLDQQGLPTIFDTIGKIIREQSKEGSGQATYEALMKGEITTTYSNAQELLMMIPSMYQISGALLPSVFHVAVLSHNEKQQVCEDHNDLMAIRETGFAMLSSQGVNECQDMAVIAHLIAMKSRVPFVHFYDGITKESNMTTNTMSIPFVKVQQFIQQQSSFLKDVEQFRQQIELTEDTHELYFQPSAEAMKRFHEAPQLVQECMDQLFANGVLAPGKKYQLFEYSGADDAEFVLVLTGTAAIEAKQAVASMNENWGAKIGVVFVRLYRPWSIQHFLKVIPPTVKSIAVLDRSEDTTSTGLPLYLDVMSSFHSTEGAKFAAIPEIIGGSYGLASQQFDVVSARTIFEELAAGSLKHGFHALAASGTSNIVMNNPSALSPVSFVERPYMKIISQLFRKRALMTNLMGNNSSEHSSFNLSSNLKNMESKTKLNSEFGFGVHMALSQQRQKLGHLLRQAIEERLVSPALSACFEKWLTTLANQPQEYDMEAVCDEILVLLENELHHSDSTVLPAIFELREYLPNFSHWIIGSDELSDELGKTGIHQILKSKENINVLILEKEVYDSNKKDIGLYAMMYGNAYVASVALYDSYSHVLRAFSEADAFKGPSIILAYTPVVADSTRNAILEMERETRKAIDTGRWPLYRWNPLLEAQGLKCFSLDSTVIKLQMRQFLERENYLSVLTKEQAANQTFLNQASMDTALDSFLINSFNKLKGNLNPKNENEKDVLILVGSDNGNAENLAVQLEKELTTVFFFSNVTRMHMNNYEPKDLELFGDEALVLFVCSTAGQGEFPTNAKEFWTALSDSGVTYNFENLRFGVFGLGDRHYWPREDEKHYFCKAPKDLQQKLIEFGGQSILPDLGIGDDQDEDGPLTGFAEWKVVVYDQMNLASDSLVPEAKVTNEDIKMQSNFLRGTLEEGLVDRSTAALSESDTQLTKFHGIYQQDNRDLREQLSLENKEKAYSFMIRVRVPGGISTLEQYLMIDSLSDEFANGNIKFTTRQAYQLQGILKWNLKATVQGINRALMDSLAACGDVNRNVMATVNPLPEQSAVHAQVQQVAMAISAHLTPQTSAYHEIWLNKKCIKGGDVDHEPIYGAAYLPRKFKIAMAIPPSNDVDVYAHCLGFIAIVDPATNELLGFNVTIGGGMGMTHQNKKTFPRLGNLLGFCTAEQAVQVAEKIVIIQRDYGDRENRKHARFKYTVDDHGVEWIHKKLTELLGYELPPPRKYKFTTNGDTFGWNRISSSHWNYCMYLEGGRIKNQLKASIKNVVTYLLHDLKCGEIRLTANQNIIFGNIPTGSKAALEQKLAEEGLIKSNQTSGLRKNHIACAALPFCGLALAEAERYLPTLITKLEKHLEAAGLYEDSIHIRMTGCPNGCGRPYLGEIGLVGRSPGIYNLYLGASETGERLNKLYKEGLNEEEIIEALRPIFQHYAEHRSTEESFGDFVVRKNYVKACLAAPLVEVRAPGATFHD